jgi:transcriptional regulator with XRE-family HTH domain
MKPMEDNEREGRVLATVPTDSFAHRLLLVRAQLGHMTVKDAAAKSGLNYAAWSKWEHGAMPRDILEVVEAISEGLGVDHEWLLRGGALSRPERKRRGISLAYPRRSLRPGGRRPQRVDGSRRRQVA